MTPQNLSEPGVAGQGVYVRLGSIRVDLTVGRPFPVYPDERTSSDRPGMSGWCHFRTHALQQTAASFNHLVGATE
jgi:hypothetical protein